MGLAWPSMVNVPCIFFVFGINSAANRTGVTWVPNLIDPVTFKLMTVPAGVVTENEDT